MLEFSTDKICQTANINATYLLCSLFPKMKFHSLWYLDAILKTVIFHRNVWFVKIVLCCVEFNFQKQEKPKVLNED